MANGDLDDFLKSKGLLNTDEPESNVVVKEEVEVEEEDKKENGEDKTTNTLDEFLASRKKKTFPNQIPSFKNQLRALLENQLLQILHRIYQKSRTWSK